MVVTLKFCSNTTLCQVREVERTGSLLQRPLPYYCTTTTTTTTRYYHSAGSLRNRSTRLVHTIYCTMHACPINRQAGSLRIVKSDMVRTAGWLAVPHSLARLAHTYILPSTDVRCESGPLSHRDINRTSVRGNIVLLVGVSTNNTILLLF